MHHHKCESTYTIWQSYVTRKEPKPRIILLELHYLSIHNHLMKSEFRFFPSNLERCEAAFKREHDIAMGYVDRPIERNVRARTAWESLVDAFPAPLEIACKMDRARLVKAMKPLYDCFNEPDPRCTWYQEIQKNAIVNWTPPAAVYALVPERG